MQRLFWNIIGVFLIAVGVWLMIDFIVEFFKLIVGLLFVMIGLSMIGLRQVARVRVR